MPHLARPMATAAVLIRTPIFFELSYAPPYIWVTCPILGERAREISVTASGRLPHTLRSSSLCPPPTSPPPIPRHLRCPTAAYPAETLLLLVSKLSACLFASSVRSQSSTLYLFCDLAVNHINYGWYSALQTADPTAFETVIHRPVSHSAPKTIARRTRPPEAAFRAHTESITLERLRTNKPTV